MSYKNGLQYTDFKRINLKAEGGLIRFEDIDSAPTSATGEYLLYVDGGVLYFDNGSSAVAVGAAGGSSGSLDGAYDGGRTITVNQGSVIMNGVNEDTAVLSLTGDGDSAGALLSFSHTTATRNDILGTASSWSVTGQGAALFLSVESPTIVAGHTGNVNLTIDAYGSGTIAIGATSTGAVTITPALTATASITITGTGGSNVFTVTAGDLVVSDGSLTITDADNASSIIVINNTATTIGASAAHGVVAFRSTSLTTGTLLHLELTEGTLNGGHYLKAWDVTAGAAVFTIAENGDVAITGTAAANAFTITNGDMLMSDGSITVVDADNAATVSITNNTATTIGAAASGGVVTFISTSLTTGALLNLELTEGTLNGGWYVRAWDATAGAAVFSVGEDGATVIAGVGGSNVLTVTAGDVLLSDTSITMVDADNANSFKMTNNTATTIGASAATGLVEFISTSLTTGTLLSLQLTEGTLNGGLYIKCWDATAAGVVFQVAEDGATTIAGSAIGTAALTLTAGDLTITSGNLTAGGKVIFSATETIAAGGTSTALSLTKTVHYIDADAGGDTFTLADGVAGQIMTILLTSSTGVATITPTNLAGGTSVTLNADGDSVVLQFMDTEWFILGGNSYAVV